MHWWVILLSGSFVANFVFVLREVFKEILPAKESFLTMLSETEFLLGTKRKTLRKNRFYLEYSTVKNLMIDGNKIAWDPPLSGPTFKRKYFSQVEFNI